MSDRTQHSGQKPTDAATLRKRAEEQARAMEPIPLSAQTPEAIEQMLHELRVHQIELEMQNEELRRAQAEIEDGRTRYFDLYDLAPVGYCTLSEKGLILEANLTAATLLGMVRGDLIKQRISRFILQEDQNIYYLHRKQLLETGEPQQCELRLIKPDGAFYWAQLTGTAAQGGDGGPVCRVVISDITERKRAEDELQRNLRMLARTEYLANIGSWEWDIDADCTRWSEELFRIFKRDRAFGAPSLAEHPDIYVAEDMERLWAAVEMCISNGTPYELDLRAVRTDGMIRQCVARGKAECDETGRIIRLVGSLQDITERKEAEKELRKSESLSRTLVNTIPDLVWLKDVDGVYLSCNKRFERFFGASETEIRGRTDYDFVDEELADSFRECDRKALAVGGPNMNEEQITDADDGHTVFLETIKTPMFDSDGNLVGVLGIGRDITERKQAEEAIRESEERFKALHNASFGGIAIHDQGVILECNQGLSEISGFSTEELIGMDGLLLISEKTREKVLKNIQDGYEKTYEAIGLRKNNDEYPVRLEARNIPYKGKKVRVVEFRDITEAKQAEAEREKLQSQLQRAQKMEAIGTLAGGIAHDFNNILGAILGYAELAQEDSPVGSILRKDIDQIVKASHRATELVKQILAFSRQAETERIPLRPAPIIKEALKMLRSSLPSTIAIVQDIDQKAGPLLADPTQIHQIVVNLCTNAFHAMEKTGGTLSISLKSRDLTRDDAALDPHVHPGRFVQLSIGDTGPGIAPEILEKIFEPYFTTKEVGKGTGMGLAIVHGIAKSYQGFVSCHSAFGQGTVFHVYLPFIAEPASLEIESAPLERMQRGNERILLVDDEEILAEMGQVMLERLGYLVTVSRNSLEALRTFQAQPDQFDLVITDQTMPGMTGMDMARRMLQIRPGMPIILCTGFSHLVDEELAKSCGIKSFMMKPLARKELAAVLRQVLDDCARP